MLVFWVQFCFDLDSFIGFGSLNSHFEIEDQSGTYENLTHRTLVTIYTCIYIDGDVGMLGF